MLTVQPKVDPRNDYDGIRNTCRAAGSRYDGILKREVLPIRRVVELARESVAQGLTLHPTRAAAEAVRSEAKRLRDEATFFEEVAGDVELYPFQSDGVGYLWQNPSALLFDEMGLGKTVQALMAMEPGSPVLVVCPATAKSVWLKETALWRKDFDAEILSEFRYPEPGEVVIINYERLLDAQELKTLPWPKTTLIFDEVHYLKNAKALRTRRGRALKNRIRKRHGCVWGLTGTPLMNKPQELWSLLVLLDLHKSAFGNFTNFAKLMGGERDEFGWVFHADQVTEEGVSIIRSLTLRRERLEVLPDLPTKTYREWEVDPPHDEDLVRQLGSIDMELLELALDDDEPIKLEEVALLSEGRKALAAYKFAETLPLIMEYEAADEPLVVFSAHRAPVEALEKRKGWAAIHGKVKAEDRAQAIQDFQDGKLKGIAITIAAGGFGITLTRAHHVLFIDLDWVPANNLQAEDRVCRIGQDRGVIVTQVVCKHPVDAAVMNTLREKAKMVSATIGKLAEDRTPSLNREELAQELDTLAALMGAG